MKLVFCFPLLCNGMMKLNILTFLMLLHLEQVSVSFCGLKIYDNVITTYLCSCCFLFSSCIMYVALSGKMS